MKKILAAILSVILLLTIVPIAYAEDSNTYNVGDIIQFGSYPQTKVTDETILTALNEAVPEWDSWTSYGYYTGTGSTGTMVQGDWMRYTDVMYGGNKYRGVKFTQYRPDWTYVTSSSSNSYQDDNGYSTNTVYWFKFEPIDWRILDPATGLVMCETIIDSQPYSNTIYYVSSAISRYAYFNDASYNANYASDYETSSIRYWLNNDFYNTAFTESEKEEISETTLNNDGYYTSVGTTGYEALDSNSTNDKIFLLSYNEVRNSDYGFSSDYSDYDKARQAQGSDYAKSQGLYVESNYNSNYNRKSSWLLRSPGHNSDFCCYVYYYGSSSNILCVFSTILGVRPALRISDIAKPEHQHSYTAAITTEPTHLKEGVMTYTCACGDSYTEVIEKLTAHTYTSKITTESTHLEEGVKTFTCECGDTYTEVIAKLEGHTYNKVVTAPTCTTQGYTTYSCACGDSYTEEIPATGHGFDGSKCKNCGFDKAENCSCNCHKGGIVGFFWKIINFFQKLFKTKEFCACGAKHW